MVAFILTFDLNVRSLRVITGSKRSNFDFSIKNLNRIQNLLRISMMFLVVVYDDNKCKKKTFLMDSIWMCANCHYVCHAKTHRLACNMIQLWHHLTLGSRDLRSNFEAGFSWSPCMIHL